jgi:MoaA/NifB/PqqE/SkfB family radical SAM enzyme
MRLAEFRLILDKIPVQPLNLYWRGEPTLNIMLPFIAKWAYNRRFKTGVCTNTCSKMLGDSFSDKFYVEELVSYIDVLTLSVDGYNQETLSKYRVGASFKQLKKNLEVIGSFKNNAERIMRVLMFRYNEDYKERFRILARLAGCSEIRWVRPIILNKDVLTQREADKWLAVDPFYQRYTLKGDTYHIKNGGECQPHLMISVDGTVAACGLDWNLDYPLGNILVDSYKKILRNLDRHKPYMKAKALPICKKCYCFSEELLFTREAV